MKSTLLCAVSATTLFAIPPVCAAEPSPAPKSELWDATMSALRELQAADKPNLGMAARFERLAAFRHTPETTKKLVKVFGTARPFTFARMPAAKGQSGYRAVLVPLHYTGPDGSSAEWTGFAVKMMLDKSGRNLVMNGNWPSIDAQDKQVKFTLRDLSLVGKQHAGFAGIWFGNVRLDAASVSMQSVADGAGVTMEGIRVDTALTERATTVDIHYGVGVKTIVVAGDRVEDFRMAVRISNIDKNAMAAMKAVGEKSKVAAFTPEQQAEAMKPALKLFGKAMIVRGAAIDIDDISAGYHGYRASIKGRIGVEGATQDELDSIPALMKKLVARFEVKVPVALVRAGAGSVARKQMAAQRPEGVDQQAAAQMGQTITDVVVGKLLNAGYARIENDVLVSTIELRGGQLSANGKEIVMPKPQPATTETAAAPANGRVLQARRIAGSCTLPDYPDEVVRQDQPLSLTMSFAVGSNGRPGNLSVAKASQSPAYDQAALVAAANCSYFPALLDGKPVAMPMSWTVVRELGSSRP